MSEELKDIHDKLKIAHEKAYSEVETNYANLVALLNQLDPIKLISQFVLTYLTVPEGQFNDESADIHKWARWAEFLVGYLLVHNYPQNVKTDIDGEDLKHADATRNVCYRPPQVLFAKIDILS